MIKRFGFSGTILSVLSLTSSCGEIDYDNLLAAKFTGSVLVLWVGENDGLLGDGRFVYVPVPGDELTLIRQDPKATVQEIKPEAIYTDGGSIPRAAQIFKGFSPWGYAPALMSFFKGFFSFLGTPERLPYCGLPKGDARSEDVGEQALMRGLDTA